MDGPARDPRLGWVQRSFVPTRLSDDTLTRVYDRVFKFAWWCRKSRKRWRWT
jgi:hypothetical protein